MTGWPGFFISFEGIDGAGKTTQVAALAASLRSSGRDVIAVRPGDTRLGELLHSFVLQHHRGAAIDPWAEALIFNAERVQLLHEVILPALRRGAVVLADRFADSTLAYQGGGRGLDMTVLLRLHRDICADVWPDLTLYLDIPARQAAVRQHAQQLPLDRIEVSPEEFHHAVRDAFERLAAANPTRIVRIDATRPATQVAQEISDLVGQRLPVGGDWIPAAHARVRG